MFNYNIRKMKKSNFLILLLLACFCSTFSAMRAHSRGRPRAGTRLASRVITAMRRRSPKSLESGPQSGPQSVPKSDHPPQATDTEESPCTICFEDTNNHGDSVVAPCGHRFHRECIKGWYDKGLVASKGKEYTVSGLFGRKITKHQVKCPQCGEFFKMEDLKQVEQSDGTGEDGADIVPINPSTRLNFLTTPSDKLLKPFDEPEAEFKDMLALYSSDGHVESDPFKHAAVGVNNKDQLVVRYHNGNVYPMFRTKDGYEVTVKVTGDAVMWRTKGIEFKHGQAVPTKITWTQVTPSSKNDNFLPMNSVTWATQNV